MGRSNVERDLLILAQENESLKEENRELRRKLYAFEADKPEPSKEYPKMLFLKGWEDTSQNITVHTDREEQDARKKGYKSLNGTH